MTKVLHITDFYHPFVGGVEQHVRTLGSELAARGHSVAVATLGHEGLPEYEDDGKVRIYRIRSAAQRARQLFHHPHRRWAPPLPDPQAVYGLWQVIAAERPEIVHGHDWLARSFLPLRPLSPARFVISLHYYTQSCAKKSLMRDGKAGTTFCKGPTLPRCLACSATHYGAAKGIPVALSQFAWSAVERWGVDIFLPVSDATAMGNRLSEMGAPYRVVPNFLSEPPATMTAEVAPYLAQLPQEKFLLFVGDFRRDKGLYPLLEAYGGLAAAPPLVLIGKRWDETPEQFPPGVVVLGEWPNAAVRQAWERCLFGLVPSIWPEPFGIVAIEAMAAGRPVIASASGGLAELVIDGETGVLVPPGDTVALRKAMAYLLENPDTCEGLGRSARKRAANYRAAAVVPQIEEIYSNLIEAAAVNGRLVEETSSSNSKSRVVSPISHRLKPMAETQNLFKQVEGTSSNVFEHVSCSSLRIYSQEREWQNKNCCPSSETLISIIINNYNYGRFLRQAIDSALAQRYRPLEVIVVDDGSTDDSPAIIAAYGATVTAVFQENGGQAAAFNAGFGCCSGQVVIFLDSDDVLLPDTAARVVETFRLHCNLARVQYRLAIADGDGRPTGETKPPPTLPLAAGDLREQLLRCPDDLRWQPTSGNAFAAWVLREIFPMPTAPYRTGADYYLSNLTPLFGTVISLDYIGGLYRIHGRNHEATRGSDPERIRDIIRRTAVTHDHIRTAAAHLGLVNTAEEPGEFLSVTFLANRLMSLKLAPQHHPLPEDSIGSVVRQGIAAAFSRHDASPSLRAAYVLWFLLVLVAPRPLARMLAEQFLYTHSPRKISNLRALFRPAANGREPNPTGA